MNKQTIGLGLLAIGILGAGYYFYTNSGAGFTPPPGSTQIPPGASYGGVQNSSSSAIWLTASGQLLSSLGQAFASVYGAVQANNNATTPGGTTPGGGARVMI